MNGPLSSLEQWDDFVESRYRPGRKKEEFRQHTTEAPAVVREFYRLNHVCQTVNFVLRKQTEYASLKRRRMGMWEALGQLSSIAGTSGPGTDLSHIDRAMQTAEAIRADGHPRWFILTGLIRDVGKMLWVFGEPQWAVVGDTFPVGCAWSDRIVFHEMFAENPDREVPAYSTPCGIYSEGCGLDRVHMSWGHDEYLYYVTRTYLPEPARYMIRYHSFYPGHRDGAYQQLMNGHDREMIEWVRTFNPYDLHSKRGARPDSRALSGYYQDLIAEFFPAQVDW